MTRFEQEITGALDKWVQENGGNLKPDYWKKHAESEMAKAVERVKDMNIDEYGVATWKKSGNCVPDDVLEMLEYAGVTEIDRKATKEAEARHIEEFFKTYRSEPDEEQLCEMRSAFGAGEVVVDVLTGRRFEL